MSPSPDHTTVHDWSPEQLPDLTGRTYLVTGANSGLGLEACTMLRRAGGDVVVGARSPEKGRAAVDRLGAVPGPGTVQLLELDLASTAQVRAAVERLRGMTDGLDAVVNNAGVMQTPQRRTEDGFELQLGTNHLGHFLLDALVFDLVRARQGRIVPVSSIAHRQVRGIDFDDPMLERGYSATKAYGQSKLANLMFGLELSRRLEAAGSPVIAATAHPGYAATNLQSTGPTGLLQALYRVTNRVLAQSAEEGAVPEVLAAAGTEARNGAYYGPTRFLDTRGPVGESTVSSAARDEEAAARLWTLSEELLGHEFAVH